MNSRVLLLDGQQSRLQYDREIFGNYHFSLEFKCREKGWSQCEDLGILK